MNCNKLTVESMVNGHSILTKPLIESVEQQKANLLIDGKTFESFLSSLAEPSKTEPFDQTDWGQILINIARTKNYLNVRDEYYMKEFTVKVLHQMGAICGTTTETCMEDFFSNAVRLINLNVNKPTSLDIVDTQQILCTKNIGDDLDCKLRNDVDYRNKYAAYRVLGPVLNYRSIRLPGGDYVSEAGVSIQYVNYMSRLTAQWIVGTSQQGPTSIPLNQDKESTKMIVGTSEKSPTSIPLNQEDNESTNDLGTSLPVKTWETTVQIVALAAIGIFLLKQARDRYKKSQNRVDTLKSLALGVFGVTTFVGLSRLML